MARTIDILRRQYNLRPNVINNAEKEQEWNELARLFVQRFQQIHGIPHDSLAGAHSFTLLDSTATEPKQPTYHHLSIGLLQEALGLPATGVYDDDTALAVRKWQDANPTIPEPGTPRGVCDEATYRAIRTIIV